MSGKNKMPKSLEISLVVITILLLLVVLVMAIFFSIYMYKDISGKDKNSKAEEKTYKVYIDSLPYGVDQKTYLNILRDVFSFWENKLNVVFKEVSSKQEAMLIIDWIKDSGSETLGHTIHSDFIEIVLGDSICHGKWKPYDYQTIRGISIHEIGHALGYDDVYNNSESVMYYKISTKYETETDETTIISQGVGEFLPFCTRNEVAKYSIEFTSVNPIGFYIVPTQNDYEKMIAGQVFNYYDCAGSEGAVRMNQTCTVGRGAGIALRNKGSSIYYTLKVREM